MDGSGAGAGEETDSVFSRAPWARDERLFAVLRRVEADGTPVVDWMRRREFPDALVRSGFNSMLGRDPDADFRCFLTGLRCYWAPSVEGPPEAMPMALTGDHLVPVAHGGTGHGDGNIVCVGYFFNWRCGRKPMPVKLAVRRHLEGLAYDREDMSLANVRHVHGRIVAFEESLRIDGLYPWQPWTFPEGQGRRAAEAMTARMRALEAEYLGLGASPGGRRDAARRAWIGNVDLSFLTGRE